MLVPAGGSRRNGRNARFLSGRRANDCAFSCDVRHHTLGMATQRVRALLSRVVGPDKMSRSRLEAFDPWCPRERRVRAATQP